MSNTSVQEYLLGLSYFHADQVKKWVDVSSDRLFGRYHWKLVQGQMVNVNPKGAAQIL